jgi:RNA polymerase primary sigma factor
MSRISKSYLDMVGRHDLISPEREVELAALIAQGSEEAIEELVVSNLRFVIHIIMKDYMKYKNFNIDELISEGNMALWHAAKKFDPAKGAKFSGYAQWWIKQRINKYMAEDKSVKIPATAVAKIRKIKQAHVVLSSELGRIPTNEEISKRTELSPKTVERLRFKHTEPISINELVNPHSSEATLEEFIQNPNDDSMKDYYDDDFKKLMFNAFTQLDDRSRYILMRRYGLDGRPELTLEELAKDPNIQRTRERVRQLQNNALIKLKKLIKEADTKRVLHAS